MSNAVHGSAAMRELIDVEPADIPHAATPHGATLPLFHRPEWAAILPGGNTLLLPIPANAEHRATSVLVQRHRSRTLPGHMLLRVQRFGYGWDPAAWSDILRHLRNLAQTDTATLRLNVEIFLRTDHEPMRRLLREHGFQPAPLRSYRHTLTLPVNAPDEALLQPRKSLRKRLREVEKAGAFVRVLTGVQFAPSLASLQHAAMQRSGGRFRVADWPAVLALSEQHPKLSRVVGLFAVGEPPEPKNLLGFAWGCMHGDHAEYHAAGSAELGPQHRGLSVSYPLLWNLLQWTRDQGGTWFDMGGVTPQEGSDDPLAGISAAKRVFSETMEEVGEEWTYEPHPWKCRLADGLGRVVQAVRGKAGS